MLAAVGDGGHRKRFLLYKTLGKAKKKQNTSTTSLTNTMTKHPAPATFPYSGCLMKKTKKGSLLFLSPAVHDQG
jgi:hypothetical protein